MLRSLLFLAAAALVAGGCATSGSTVAPDHRGALPALPAGEIGYEVFLIGNTAGTAESEAAADAVLAAVAAEALRAGESSAVVLLGDQTRAGLPDSSSAGFASAAAPLDRLARHLAGVPGRVVAVPGDRDWAEGRAGVRRQARALAAAFGRDVLLPEDQSGGPASVALADGLRLVALDTAWWLRDADDRPRGRSENEDVRTPADVAVLLDAALTRADDDRRIVVGHHPLRSVGEHAGHRTAARSLPTLGLGPLVDQTFGMSRQSLASPGYRRLRGALDAVVARHDGVVYASSHDHSVQLFDVRRSETVGQTMLVSGTGGGHTRGVTRGRGAAFASARPGYQRLIAYPDGSLWAETVLVDPGTGARTVAMRREIAGGDPARTDPGVPDPLALEAPGLAEAARTQAADDDFAGNRIANGPLRRAFWGRGYRDVWRTPVSFPVLDLARVGGGLTPAQLGGGMQTTTLRLNGADGRVYELRLVEKSGLAQVPEDLREGAVGDVVLDFRSAVNPYGPIVTGPLGEATDVLGPFFELVVVPDDARLGRYRPLFAGRLAHLSVRPAGDVSDAPGLRGAADVVSEGRFYRKMTEDQSHRADEAAVLRARLLDMVLADWDRHAGQWRWAAYAPGDLDPALEGEAATRGKVYRPIARDRDFAFHDVRGFFPALISRFGDPRLQPFRGKITRVGWLNHNGFAQDRRLLAWTSRNQVAQGVRELQALLPDEVIAEAVAALPPEVAARIGERYRRTLAQRRDDLPRAAGLFYDQLAEIVDLVGTDQREHFTAERHPDGRVTVTLRSMRAQRAGETLAERTFYPSETREVRLYGLGGRDVFEVTGRGPNRISIRIIGGRGRDSVAVAGAATLIDTPEGVVVAGAHARRASANLDADNGFAHLYDPTEATTLRRMLYPRLAYRATDGLIVGASHTWLVPGFRLRPWAARHTLTGTFATATQGLAASYTGRMRDAFSGLDLDVQARASTPRYARNFYGIGNATARATAEVARLNLAQVHAAVGLGRIVGEGVLVTAGPVARWSDPESPSAALVPAAGGAEGIDGGVDYRTNGRVHTGAFARAALSTADRPHNPHQGVRLNVGAAAFASPTGGQPYGQIGAEGVGYVPLAFAPQLTLALRGGVDHRVGTYPFYDAAVLGGEGALGASVGTGGGGATLRGLQRERYAGRTAASGSIEARARLFTLPTYVAPFRVGALAFADAGRVWAEQACPPGSCAPASSANRLHWGAGGGLWLEALDRAAVSATVARSSASTLVAVGLGFGF